MLRFFRILFSIYAFCAFSFAHAEPIDAPAPAITPISAIGIAATAGGTAITTYDLQERVKLAILTSNLKDSLQVREQLLPQMLQKLIDEALIENDATRIGMKITPDELQNALNQITFENKKTPDQLTQYIEGNSIDFKAFKDQIKAQIQWQKILYRHLRPQILISDQEISERLENIGTQKGLTEYHISEIILPIEASTSEKDVLALAQKLREESLKEDRFGVLAKEFSRSASAARAGEVGWVSPSDLHPNIEKYIITLNPGEITEPIRLPQGFILMKLNDKRASIEPTKDESEVGLKQAFTPLLPHASQADIQKIASDISTLMKPINQCADFDEAAIKSGSTAKPILFMTQLKELHPTIAKIVADLPLGSVSEPIKSASGIHVLMVCERTRAQTSLAAKEKIGEIILSQKLNLRSQHYLRDLRRNAFIDIKLTSH